MEKPDRHVVRNSYGAGAIVLILVIIILILFGAWVFTVIAHEASDNTKQTNTQAATSR